MADVRRNGKFNQKRESCFGVFQPTEAEILDTSALVATLPERVVVISIMANVLTASGTATATLDVKVNGSVVADEIAVATAGVKVSAVTPQYLETGGDIEVLAGAVAPAAGDLEVEVIIEYLELDKVNGEYTSY